MQAIKAIYDGVDFKPRQPIPVEGQYEVVITFIEPLRDAAAMEKAARNASYLSKIQRGIDQCAAGRGLSRDMVELNE